MSESPARLSEVSTARLHVAAADGCHMPARTRSAGRGVGSGAQVRQRRKSEAGPCQVGLLLNQPDELLAELELLLDIDSDERRGKREVGGAVDECGSVEDDRRRRGRRALLALRARPVD